MDETSVIVTERLELPPLSAAAIAALIDGDRERLAAATGAVWPLPLAPPPEMADALPFFLEQLGKDPGLGPWWARLMVLRRSRQAVGSAGLAGRPDEAGTVTIGYAVYPAFQGQGYATEAVRGLVAWARTQPGVRRIRATIPTWNTASQRVAANAGLRRVGRTHDETAGEVKVWQIER